MPLPKSFTTVTSLSKIIALILFILLPFIGFYLGIQYEKSQNNSSSPTNTPTPAPIEEDTVFCTMDAKACPDGSYVGRIPPNCQFAPCPPNSITPALKEYDLETYAVELTQAQYDKFLQSIKKKNQESDYVVDGSESESGVWKYWDEFSVVQNSSFLVRGNQVCTIGQFWCVGVVDWEKECSSYNLTDEKPGEMPQGMGAECCHSLKTNRPYLFGCADFKNKDSNNPEKNKELTYQVLKEGGIVCTNQLCLAPVKSSVFILTPEFYSN